MNLRLDIKFFSFILSIGLVFNQEIPISFFQYKKNNILYDIGFNWSKNSNIGAPRFYDINKIGSLNPDSLYVDLRFGLNSINKNISLYNYSHFIYKKNLYGYLHPRIVSDVNMYPEYSGIAQDISRASFISGETDYSGIGFQNEWLAFQFGRGREIWGSGSDIEIIFSETSPSFDYAMLSSNYGNLKVKYLKGFLGSIDFNLNRYISARAFEWHNKKSLIVSFSEIVIYSGKNRGIDFGYLNPIATHLEIELNNRLNNIGTNHSNAVWQFSMDFLLANRLRYSLNYLIDEYVIDEIEKKRGKQHGLAFSNRLAYSPIIKPKILITFYLSYIHVGSPTFRHINGANNFIVRSEPMGWQYGSDGREIRFGLNLYNKKDLIMTLYSGLREIGEESIIYRSYDPYEDYLESSFPSGENIKKYTFYKASLEKWFTSNSSCLINLESSEDNLKAIISLNIFFSKLFKA